MALTVNGHGGTVWVGRHKLATLTTWRKAGPKLTFAPPSYINPFAAGLGQAPTVVDLPLTARITARYTITGGRLEDGAFRVERLREET